jgi:hypothetical protein
MAPRQPIEPLISVEWAESLVGLSMKVPEYWWDGCNGYKHHDGKIDSFDIDSQKWNLLLDAIRDEDVPYLMTYSAVSMYADEDSSTLEEYQLPHRAVTWKVMMRLKLRKAIDTLERLPPNGLKLR